MIKFIQTLFLFIGITVSHPSLSQDWDWAKSLPGGSSGSIETDPAGNIYITGNFAGMASFGSHTLISKGGTDIYVVKYTPSMEVLWAKSFGGNDSEAPYDLTLNPITGGVSITGTFRGTWPSQVATLTSKGDSDIFVISLDAQGNLVWAQQGGGPGFESSNSISIDNKGNTFITGTINNHGGVVYFDQHPISGISYVDMFLAKYDPSGNVLWVKNAGAGPVTSYFSQTSGQDLAVDTYGNAYVTGMHIGNTVFDHYELPSGSSMFGYLAKYAPDGKVLWVKEIGSIPPGRSFGDSFATSVAVDASANIILTGRYTESAQFDHISLISPGSESSIFVAKLNNSGDVIWAKKADGTGYEASGSEVHIANDGSYLVTGQYQGNTSFDSQSINGIGYLDVFITSYATDGTVQWVKSAGSSGKDAVWNIVQPPSGGIYLIGHGGGSMKFGSTTIEAGAYVAKLSTNGTCNISIPNIGPDLFVCSGEAVALGIASQAGYTYKWFPTAGLSDSKISNPTLTLSNALTEPRKYTYFLTVTAPNGCTASDQIEITVSPTPVANAGPDQEVCAGGLVTIGSPLVKGATYSWTVTPSIDTHFDRSSAVPSIRIPASAKDIVYTFKLKVSYGECFTEDEVKVTAKVNVAAPTATGGSTCVSGAFRFRASGAPEGGWYNWYDSPVGGSKIPNTYSNYFDTPVLDSSKTYYVSAVSKQGCESSRTPVTAIINPAPTAPKTPEKVNYCQGEKASALTAEGQNLKWYSSPTTTYPLSAAPIPSTTSPGSKDYYVSQVVNGCESPRAKITVNILAPPTAPVVANASRCGAGSVTLSASGAPPEGGYRWYTTATGGTPISSSNSYTTPELTGTTNYYVSVVDNAGCESQRTKVAVTVIPVPEVTILTPSTSFCKGEGGIILETNVVANTYTTFQWYFNGERIEGSTSSKCVADRPGEYTVQVMMNGCSRLSEPIAVSHVLPVLNNIISGPQTVCPGEAQIHITGSTPSGGNGGYTYTWERSSTSATSGFSLAPGVNYQQNYTQSSIAQTTWFRRWVSSGGCSFVSEVVKIETAPAMGQISKIQGETNFCANQTNISYYINKVSGAESYTWTVPPGFTIVSGQGTSAIKLNAGNNNGQLKVTANSRCGTTRVSMLDITVSTLPSINAGLDQSVCIGAGIVSLTGFSPIGGIWSGNGVTMNGSFNPAIAGTGSHILTYSVTDGNCTTTASKTVTVMETPAVSFIPIGQVCSSTTELNLTGGQPAGGAYSGVGITDGVFNAVTAGVGTHEITYTYTKDGCTATATQYITVATCTGVEESEVASAIKVYPNPTTSSFQIEAVLVGASNATIRVFDLAGKLVYDRKVKSTSGELRQVVDLSGNNRGLYLLCVVTDKGAIYRRIVFD